MHVGVPHLACELHALPEVILLLQRLADNVADLDTRMATSVIKGL